MKMKNIHVLEEAARCLMCKDAPCSLACKKGNPARFLRAIRFGNEKFALSWIKDCTAKDLENAERECIHYDRPVRIREVVNALQKDEFCLSELPSKGMAPSLAIEFCGIKCENPFFLASSAVSTNYDMVARAFDAGWAGVVYKTICIQDIKEVSPRFDAVKDVTNEFYGFRNMEQLSENPMDVDFDILCRLKKAYPTKVVVASIMGQTEEQWIQLAIMSEKAGVDAIELNFSCPQMRLESMGSDVGQDPELVNMYTSCVKKHVSIPVIAKMTPNITHISQPAKGAYLAKADGVSAINTIKSVTMNSHSDVSGKKTVSGYSGRAVKPLALRFILELAQDSELKGLQLSGIGGIENWQDALEFIQLGCRNVQVCTAVMQYGNRIIEDMILGLSNYLAERGIDNLEDIVGEELPRFVSPHDLDRETIVYPRVNKELCIGCGRCYISCQDGGHQAIEFNTETRLPRINANRCVGCHLCRLVCPTGAFGVTKRIIKKK